MPAISGPKSSPFFLGIHFHQHVLLADILAAIIVEPIVAEPISAVSVEMEGESEAETAAPDELNTQEKKTKPKVQKRKAQPVRRPKVNQKPKTKQYTMCQHCQCPTPVGRMFRNVKDIRERAARLKLKSMALRAKPPPAAGAQAQIPTFKDNTARSCAKRLAGRLVCRNWAFELVDSEVESASDAEEMSEDLHSPTELVSESE